MNFSIFVFLLLLFSSYSSWAQTIDPVLDDSIGICNDLPPDVSTVARDFMFKKGLINSDEEHVFTSGELRWALYKTVEVKRPDICLLIMNVCYKSNSSSEYICDSTDIYEVLVYRDSKIELFENVIELPTKVYAKFGPRSIAQNPYDFYYAEITGPSILAVKKAEYAKLFWSKERFRNGFSGLIVRGSKSSFDPTPVRHWSIVNATYTLRMEHNDEVHDVYPHDFDTDFDGMFTGCLKKEVNGVRGCEAKPWNGSFNSVFAEFF